jgi:CRP-like cAMP-binding protein
MSHEEDLYGAIYEPGEAVFRQGEPGDVMYLIQSGAIEYSYLQGDTKQVLTVLGKGDFFGEMALFGHERRPATTTAVQRSRVLPLNRAALLEQVRKNPGVAFHLLRGLYLRIQFANRQIQEAVANDEALREALARREETAPCPEAIAPGRLAGPEPEPAQTVDASAGISMDELVSLWDVDREAIWFEPGQDIYQQGEQADAMYILLSGSAELAMGRGSGRFVLYPLQSGDFFGESEMLTDLPRSATATAVARAQVLPIARDEFAEQIEARPELALFFSRN